ncbi:MAG TPA: hypothetical protein VMM82_09810, partial [Spirochaetia bacterium]|nr:hypothetical protein [Spirochaetia bacterium]
MKSCRLSLVLCAVMLVVSCGPVPDPRSGKDVDLQPPQIESICSTGPSQVSVCFDEEASLAPEKTRITPALAVRDTTGPSKEIV